MNQKNLNIVFVIVIVLLITAVAYFAFGKKAEQLSDQNEVVNSNTAQLPINIKPNQTAGWKTYTNTKYGYQIKAPSNFNNQYQPNGWVNTSNDDDVPLSINETEGGQWYLQIYTDSNSPCFNPPINTDLISWLKQCNKQWQDSTDATLSIENIQSTNYIIDGIQAVKIPYQGMSHGYHMYNYYLIKDNHLFLISVLDEPDQKILANQIFSTFKFTK